MPFKTDANGALLLDDKTKQPIYVDKDGREAAFDVDTTVSTIGRLNGEARAHREAKEAAEAALKPFRDFGIADPEEAAKAITLAKNLKDGDLVTAGKVQEIKDAAQRTATEAVAAATRAAQEKERALTEQNSKLTQDLNNHIIGGSFAGSKFIKDKLAIPADIAQKVFGDRFKVDGGKLVPLDSSGNPIFSAVRHGEIADFEEALPLMVNAYANKDMIMRGSGATGSGANASQHNSGGKRTYTRSQFNALDPAGQRAAATEAATGKAEIVD